MKESATRQKIIETASQLFYANGYNLTGINEIIATAGIAKATLYSHFKSKEDICLAYLQFKQEVFIESIGAFCLSKPNGVEQVLSVFDFLTFFFQQEGFNGCWCIKTVAEIPRDNSRIRSEIQEQKRGLIQFIQNLIVSNLEVLSDGEATAIARQIYLLYESAVAESHLHQEPWPIDVSKQIASKVLIRN